MLGGCALSRAKIGGVVRVDSIGHRGELAVRGELIEHGEKLVFAVIAAICVIYAVGWIVQFVGLNEFVPRTGSVQEAFHLLAIECGIASGNSRNRQGAI